MALTTGTYESSFRYDLATKQITFTDTTDYAAQGTAAADVTIVIKVESAISGIIYNNTNHSAPDIDPDVSVDSTIVIPLPLDAGGLPEQGLYTVTLQYKDTGGLPLTVTVNKEKTFTLSYTSPVVGIEMEVDCFTPVLTATDDTSYTKGGVDPTITRAFQINYPLSMGLPAVTGTASVLQTSNFYYVTGEVIEHSSGLTSTLSYSYPDGWYVKDIVSGSEFIGVSCPADLCDIYCCLRSQWLKYKNAKSTNTVLANQELAKFNQIMGLSQLVGQSLRCGKETQSTDYVNEILLIADCDAGCSCADGQPQLVTGLAINGNTVIVEAGTGVSISSVTGGGTTTYTVSLSTVNVDKLAATYNSVVTAGTNITSVTDSSITSGNVTTTTYVVNATDTVVESTFVEVLLAFVPGAVPSYTVTSQKQYGTVFQTVTDAVGGDPILDVENDGSIQEWQQNYNSIIVQNFFSGASTDYFPEIIPAEEVTWYKGVRGGQKQINGEKVGLIDIYDKNASDFKIRFINPKKMLGSNVEDKLSSVKLIIKIQA